jgi:hypothetical protein
MENQEGDDMRPEVQWLFGLLQIQNDRLRHHQTATREWINRFTWLVLTLQGAFFVMSYQRQSLTDPEKFPLFYLAIPAGLTFVLSIIAFKIVRDEAKYQSEAMVSVWLLERELGLTDQKMPFMTDNKHKFKTPRWVPQEYIDRINNLQTPDDYVKRSVPPGLFGDLKRFNKWGIRMLLRWQFIIYAILAIIEVLSVR